MIDSHAHVAFYQFDEDRDEVIARAREASVGWIEIGTDVESSQKAVRLAENHVYTPGVEMGCLGATVGVHPSDVADGVDWGEIEKLLDEERVVAVGEVGIDLYHQQNLDEQVETLGKFVDIAEARDLPVVFHVRSGEQDAHDEMLKFLKERSFGRGVIHTFSGTTKQAKEYLELGLYLSFSGVVTFKNAGEIVEVAKAMPMEKILIETDCPFLAPEPFRGKRNEPAYVKYVAEKIAEVRGITVGEVERAAEENTKELLRV